MESKIEDIIDRIAKIEISNNDMLVVFVDLSGLSRSSITEKTNRIKSEFKNFLGQDTRVAVIDKNVDIAVISKTFSEEKPDVS
jgi:hypothetical protein